ncbi:MAG TPA: hypothetical protein DCE41_03730 [Cytophagales bacterium]|nr:hypothetical protein [Cytophagales bacterium]HAA21394.1 hypothetical protein [Cytophagales bacterium]HAP58071.1 hypothetical protein [Cytophagales bacterium]
MNSLPASPTKHRLQFHQGYPKNRIRLHRLLFRLLIVEGVWMLGAWCLEIAGYPLGFNVGETPYYVTVSLLILTMVGTSLSQTTIGMGPNQVWVFKTGLAFRINQKKKFHLELEAVDSTLLQDEQLNIQYHNDQQEVIPVSDIDVLDVRYLIIVIDHMKSGGEEMPAREG